MRKDGRGLRSGHIVGQFDRVVICRYRLPRAQQEDGELVRPDGACHQEDLPREVRHRCHYLASGAPLHLPQSLLRGVEEVPVTELILREPFSHALTDIERQERRARFLVVVVVGGCVDRRLVRDRRLQKLEQRGGDNSEQQTDALLFCCCESP